MTTEGKLPMANFAIQWSGLLLIVGAALFGVAVVMISLKPVVNQVMSPGTSLLLFLSSMCLLLLYLACLGTGIFATIAAEVSFRPRQAAEASSIPAPA